MDSGSSAKTTDWAQLSLPFVQLKAVGTSVSVDELMDRVIAECGGDVYGALKALLLINERLESELRQFYELGSGDPAYEPVTMH